MNFFYILSDIRLNTSSLVAVAKTRIQFDRGFRLRQIAIKVSKNIVVGHGSLLNTPHTNCTYNDFLK